MATARSAGVGYNMVTISSPALCRSTSQLATTSRICATVNVPPGPAGAMPRARIVAAILPGASSRSARYRQSRP